MKVALSFNILFLKLINNLFLTCFFVSDIRERQYCRFILKLYINEFPNLFSFVYLFITLLFRNVLRFIQKPIWSQSCELEVHKNMARLFLQIGLAYFQKDIFFPHYISILYQNIMKIQQVSCVILCGSEVFIEL